jgi:hypothetical protein
MTAAGCATSATPNTQTVSLDTEFTLAPSGRARIEGGEVEVRFVGISEDSRCPRDVACVWAGQAKVRLDITSRRSEPVLRDVLEQQSVIADQYEIKVVRVLPYPETSGAIPPDDYRVTLLATLAEGAG